MKIAIVVATAENQAIGKNNDLLWRLPNDMKFFKNITWGLPVIMGRKTFDSLKGIPLKGRLNIVITRQKNLAIAGALVVNSLEAALATAKAENYNECMVIGGAEIYQQAISITDTIYVTKVAANFADADAFFPSIDTKKFTLVKKEDYQADAKHAYNYCFEVWNRN